MTHLENIVQAMYAALSVVPNLYVMRLRPFELTELPASNLLIESVDPRESRVIGAQDWDVQFSVVSLVGGDEPFAPLESLRAQIHQLLLADPTLGGLSVDLAAGVYRFEPDEELPVVRLWQQFSLQYRNNHPEEP